MLNQTIEQIITEINIERVKSKESNRTSSSPDHTLSNNLRNHSSSQRSNDQTTKSIGSDIQRSCRRSIMRQNNNLNGQQKIYRKKWTKNQQQLLCNLIGRYGSDFTFLQTQFPNKTRKQLKKKYQQIHKNKRYLNKIQRIEQQIIRQRRKSFFDQEIMQSMSIAPSDEKKMDAQPPMPQQFKNSFHDMQDESQSY